MKLYDKDCKHAEVREKPYKMADGGGLYLEVRPNGSKLWRMKYRINGKEKRLALGVYPIVGLADAREGREEAKKLLAKGIDPSEAKQKNRRDAVREAHNTFKAVALEWHENQKGRWSDNHYNNVLHRLQRDVFPHLGKYPITQIEAPDLLDMLRKLKSAVRWTLQAAHGKSVDKSSGTAFRQEGASVIHPSISKGRLKPAKPNISQP